MRILNFGSMNLDFVYEVESIVRPGETVRALSRRTYCGGKGLNQSVALARAGADVCHAGLIGTTARCCSRCCRRTAWTFPAWSRRRGFPPTR